MTVPEVFASLRRDPAALLRNWNWKAASISAAIRALIYLFVNLRSGWRAGLVSMLVEAIYRVPLSGLCGSFTQAFRAAQPAWAATLAVMLCLPIVAHSFELLVHSVQGAPRLWSSLKFSVAFTIIAGLFNLYAMRRGVLVVGSEGNSMRSDMRRIPATIGAFLASAPVALYSKLTQQPSKCSPSR